MSQEVYRVNFKEKSVLEKIRDFIKRSDVSHSMVHSISKATRNLSPIYKVRLEGSNIKPLDIFIALQGDSLTITLANPEYNENTCKIIITDAVQTIYKKVTGRELSIRDVKIDTAGTLNEILCHQCMKSIPLSASYRCQVCGDIYCFTHRFPERHGCKREKSRETLKISSSSFAKTNSTNSRVKVVITRIPCG